MKKILLTVLCFLMIKAMGQNCSSYSVNAPVTINGVAVTGSGTGAVGTYSNGIYYGCGGNTPNGCTLLGGGGGNSNFIYTYTFSKPVNDIVIGITGSNGNEQFTFTTNAVGTPQIFGDIYSCLVINGNVLTVPTTGIPSAGAGGFFRIHNSSCYTSITISGPGGSGGSNFALCPNSIVPSCDPCTIIKASATPLSGTITNTTYTNTVYRVANNITLSGNVTFSGCEVILDPNVTITVAANALVNIDNSHFYTCNGMWQGFDVQPTGHLIMNASSSSTSSLIEDAVVAINFYYPAGTVVNNTNNAFLSVTSAVFNRNQTSIKIDNLQYGASTPNSIYSFFMKGSVITSRKLGFIPGQRIWPRISDIKKLKNPSMTVSSTYLIPNSLSSPYIDDVAYPFNVAEAYLKNGVQKKPDYGIVLKNIATQDNSNGISLGRIAEVGANFDAVAEVAVGKSSSDFNLFDNVNIGIDANAATLFVASCVFQNPPIESLKPIGINLYNGIQNKASITFSQGYDMATIINSVDYNNLVLTSSYLRSSRYSALGNVGNIGISATSNGFSNLNIFANEFTNLNTGMFLNDKALNSVKSSGVIEINNNILQAAHPNITAVGTESFYNGIQFNGGTIAAGSAVYQPLNCTNNTLTNVSCGIMIQYLLGKDFNISSNTISVANNAAITTSKFGIYMMGGSVAKSGFIENNIIKGSCNTSVCNQTGIYLNNQVGAKIGCNIVGGDATGNITNGGLTNGFRFVNANAATQFFDNMMYPSNRYGYTLEGAAGAIPQQGKLRSSPNATDGITCNNSWGATVQQWNALGHFMTNINGSNPLNAKLVVNSNIWMNPNGNGNASAGYTAYSMGNGLIQGNDDNQSGRCHWINPPPKIYGRFANGLEADPIDVGVVDGSFDIPLEDGDQRLYVLKQQLYDRLMGDQGMVVANPIFQDFVQDNTWGSFDFIYYTAQYLAQRDVNSVDELLSYFPSNNIVDDNYWQYYNWINQMLQDPNYQPPLNDVFAMANLCPATNGSVVYAAQNLYMQLIGDIYRFENICESQPAARSTKKPKLIRAVNSDKLNVDVQVYPNPTTGKINIKLPLLTSNNWQVNITDIFGRIILVKALTGSNSIISLPDVKGMVFVKVINTQTNQEFISKIIVQ